MTRLALLVLAYLMTLGGITTSIVCFLSYLIKDKPFYWIGPVIFLLGLVFDLLALLWGPVEQKKKQSKFEDRMKNAMEEQKAKNTIKYPIEK